MILSNETIPKIINTIRYILSEIERVEKEEFFRFERVKEKKKIKEELDELLKEIALQLLYDYNESPQIEDESIRSSECNSISETNEALQLKDEIIRAVISTHSSLHNKTGSNESTISQLLPELEINPSLENIVQISELTVLEGFWQEIEDYGSNHLVLSTDDELLSYSESRVSPTDLIEHALEKEILPANIFEPLYTESNQIILVTGKKITCESYQQCQLHENTPKERKSPPESRQSLTKSRQSLTSLQGTSPEEIPTTSRGLQRTGADQKTENGSHCTLKMKEVGSARSVLSERMNSDLATKLAQKLQKIQNVIQRESSKTSKIDSFGRIQSKISIIIRKLMKLLQKNAKKNELIVLKQSEIFEDHSDLFIPPLNNPHYAFTGEIVRAEELTRYLSEQSDWELKEEIKEATRTLDPTKFVSNSTVPSLHELPHKECSESHIHILTSGVQLTKSKKQSFSNSDTDSSMFVSDIEDVEKEVDSKTLKNINSDETRREKEPTS